MKFKQYYSSSKGNLYTLTSDSGSRLLIECGVTWKKLVQALDHDLSGIEGCLLSHEHFDHSKSVREVMLSGINVYASAGTIQALGIENERRTHALDELRGGVPYYFGGFKVSAHDAHHDAEEPLLFTIRYGDKAMLFATDTSHITQRFKMPFDIIAIECAYDKDILMERVDTKDIDEALAKRLLTSHMEKQNTMRYLMEYCDLSKCREIHLLHMSEGNIDREKTRKEFEDKLFIDTIIVKDTTVGKHARHAS